MRVSWLRGLAAGLAAVPLVLPPSVVAAWPHAATTPAAVALGESKTAVHDIALRDHGVLLGQVTRTDGSPLAGVPVSLAAHGTVVGSTATNPQGVFSLTGLRGGVYQVTVPGACQTYRLWAPRTAPPAACRMARLVANPDLVRGQSPTRGGFLIRPLIIGGLVATAVAVPLAVHNHNSSTNLVTE